MTTLLVPREQVRTVLDERIGAGEELLAKTAIVENSAGHGDWIYLFEKWREHTIAELRAVYDDDDIPFTFEAVTRTAGHSSPRFAFPYNKSSLEAGLWQLRDLMKRLPLTVEPEALRAVPGEVDKTPGERGASAGGPNVFMVHGRAASGFLDSAARFIEQVGLNPIILGGQPSEGRTLIEKFEATALDVGYAIALLTPEDSAYGPEDGPPPCPNRARQNVVLEVGYFMAKLGRKRVVALRQEGLELPTDILGVVYIPLDDGGAWKTLLARELQAAGYDIDLRGLLG